MSLLYLYGMLTRGLDAASDLRGEWKTTQGLTMVIRKAGGGYIVQAADRSSAILKRITYRNGKWVGLWCHPADTHAVLCSLQVKGQELHLEAPAHPLCTKVIFVRV